MQLAQALIAKGTYRTVMILNCELNFREYANFDIERMEELEHVFSAFTIGEAATATLLVGESDRDDFVLSFKTAGDFFERSFSKTARKASGAASARSGSCEEEDYCWRD